ncbi:hypothetical protein [Pseudomonas sp. PDM32]
MSYWLAQLGQLLARQQTLRKDWKLPVSGKVILDNQHNGKVGDVQNH